MYSDYQSIDKHVYCSYGSSLRLSIKSIFNFNKLTSSSVTKHSTFQFFCSYSASSLPSSSHWDEGRCTSPQSLPLSSPPSVQASHHPGEWRAWSLTSPSSSSHISNILSPDLGNVGLHMAWTKIFQCLLPFDGIRVVGPLNVFFHGLVTHYNCLWWLLVSTEVSIRHCHCSHHFRLSDSLWSSTTFYSSAQSYK